MSYQNITRDGVDAADSLTFTEKRITLSTVVTHRGRQITVTAEGYSCDQFADLLDKRFGETHAAPACTQPTESAPACPVHNRTMKAMHFADKQGRTHMCTAKAEGGWCDQRA